MKPPKSEQISVAKIGCFATIAAALITVIGAAIVAYINRSPSSNQNNNQSDVRPLGILNSNKDDVVTEKSPSSPSTSSNPSLTPTPKSTPNPPTEKKPILTQKYDGILIELTKSEIVGSSVSFDFKVTNTNSIDKRFLIGGNDGGNYGFLGFYSTMFADGNRYVAAEAYIAGNGGGRANLILPGNGQSVTASLKFKNIPSSLRIVERLNLCVSTKDSYPSEKLPFEYITLSH